VFLVISRSNIFQQSGLVDCPLNCVFLHITWDHSIDVVGTFPLAVSYCAGGEKGGGGGTGRFVPRGAGEPGCSGQASLF
jgi:hypothetical protein